MNFLIKFFSCIVILITVYILAIFIFPKQSDEFAESIWTKNLNTYLRNFKTWTDSVWEDLIQLKMAQDQINKARDAVKQTQEQINNKVEQANRVYENWKKVLNTTEELKNSIEELATLSASWNNTSSWKNLSSTWWEDSISWTTDSWEEFNSIKNIKKNNNSRIINNQN